MPGAFSAPMQVAQLFLTVLARNWDGPLEALEGHLGRSARKLTATPTTQQGE
jgi:hypothetical protein